MSHDLREHALAIWHAGVDAVRPRDLMREALGSALARRGASGRLWDAVARASRVLVVGGGKAGAAMSAALEEVLADRLDKVAGVVNVPADLVRPLKGIRLHAARPAGSNHPTVEGVVGTEEMLKLVADAGPDDICVCLLSGGGSALLPAPAPGITLEDKQTVTRLLHACGATIHEMNAVRKHLSRIKGGGLAQAFRGKELFSLIISDVVGDPIDVIASGPTAADSSTFADALRVLDRYGIGEKVPESVRRRLEEGAAGRQPETLKQLPANVHNIVIGNNRRALDTAHQKAQELGYAVLDLGSFIEGETQQIAVAVAGVIRSILADRRPLAPPCCILSGGETTVTLDSHAGRGGRNQEFVLAAAAALGPEAMHRLVVLSGGTDGEDGPTDAAGAVADADTLLQAAAQGLDVQDFLERHDAYPFFEAVAGLLRTGLTQTNVMDVRVILVT
jgi:hydroxypyruvate reductase/glycerate 2-kinase